MRGLMYTRFLWTGSMLEGIQMMLSPYLKLMVLFTGNRLHSRDVLNLLAL